MMHILSTKKSEALWAWASGNQAEPQPDSTSLCTRWSAGRAKPGEQWKSMEQHRANGSGDTCPACKEKARAKYRIQNADGTIHNAGTDNASWYNLERARKEVNYEKGQRIVEDDGMQILWEVL